MKHIIALVLTFLLYINTFAQQSIPKLSDASYIAVYTCAPGEQLYAQFGHSAIGVIDPKNQINIIFNYGTFSFNTPNFYLKFCAGKLLYRLSVEPLFEFINIYNHDNRQVIEQRLNLTLDQRQHLFNLLSENYQPENRYYQYDFFYDNCASRILDMLYTAFDTSLTYTNTDTIPLPTLRHCIYPYLANSPWTKAGIDLALGSITDRCASKRTQAFLPDKLCDYLSGCNIDSMPLVNTTNIVVYPTASITKSASPLTPNIFFTIVFITILALTIWKPKINWNIADSILFGILGFLGLVVALLWFATDHGSTVYNYNLLWASPLYLIYIFTLKAKTATWHKWLHITLITCNIIMLIGIIIPQQFNSCFYIIAATATTRLLARLIKKP